MARRSRASKGRGPTRRERRESEAGGRGPQAGSGEPADLTHLSKRKQRAARNIARQAELERQRGGPARPWYIEHRRRVVSGAVVALAALCTLVIGVGWWLAGHPPEWWDEVDTGSAEVVMTSRAVENWAVSTMTRSRDPGEPWAVTLTEDDANAWLGVRLPLWVESERGEWPEGIRSVRVRFRDGLIVVGADIREPGSETARVVAAAIRLSIDGDGAARASIEWTQINRLKLPGSVGVSRISEWIESAGDEEAADRIASLMRGDLSSDSLSWKLEDGRRVRVHGIRISDDQVELTCTTVPARRLSSGG